MSQATLNIRIPEDLKQRGSAVLSRGGVSISDAVRKLYEYMDETQELPEYLQESYKNTAGAIDTNHKRELLRSMIGILPRDITLEEAREARLVAKGL